MYITSLHILNHRCFRDAELSLQYPGRPDGTDPPNVNLVVGDNGAGKTSVLKAIALATLGPILDSGGFVPYRLVRQTREESPPRAEIVAELQLHTQDAGTGDRSFRAEEQVRVAIDRIHDIEKVQTASLPSPHWEHLYIDRSPAFLVVGYGANRRVESASTFDEGVRQRSRQLRYQRVSSLFEEQSTLTPLGAWLPRLRAENRGRYRQVVNLINRLLPDECHFADEIAGGELLFELRGAPVPFPALSDGYRAYIGWITDLLYHVWLGTPSGAKLADNRGIVLVDEIDLHLHPAWQRTVIPRLADGLPNLQFVFTSHSPIVAGTLGSRNLFVVELDESGASVVRQLEERIHGLSAEQILLSSYFNLQTTRAAAMEDELTILSQRAQMGDSGAAVEYLRRLTEGSSADDTGARATRSAG